jgi:hypothetical protein
MRCKEVKKISGFKRESRKGQRARGNRTLMCLKNLKYKEED